MDGDKFVLIGPAGWQLLGLVAIMAGVAWWLARKPGAPPPMIVVFFQALAWRMFPALSSWREENQRRARDRFVKDYDNVMSPDTGSGGAPDGSIPPVPPLVLPLSDAANTGTIIPVPEDLSRSALLDILARQKIDNKYVFSGNKLVDLFASTPHAASRNAVLEEIAKIRKDDEPTPKKPTARLERPAEGW